MTNGDKIRSMTDDELAEKICRKIYCIQCPCCKVDKETRMLTCNGHSVGDYRELLNWLKQEAEKEGKA